MNCALLSFISLIYTSAAFVAFVRPISRSRSSFLGITRKFQSPQRIKQQYLAPQRAFLSKTIKKRVHTFDENGLQNRSALPPFDLNLLLIDHYDSFTYNLVDLLSQLCTRPPIVRAADCSTTWEGLLEQLTQEGVNTSIDGIVLSPGPGRPNDPMSQLAIDIVRRNPDLPILGVCLGHQILGEVYGSQVVQLPDQPVHGQVHTVQLCHTQDSIWNGLPEAMNATRYHSLHVLLEPGGPLIPTSYYGDGVVMALRHDRNPHHGVQFHPESVGSLPAGRQLLSNFCKIAVKEKKESSLHQSHPKLTDTRSGEESREPREMAAHRSILIKKVELSTVAPLPEDVMNTLLRDADYSYWLDGQTDERSSQTTDSGHISILGSSHQRLEYWGQEQPSHRQGLFRQIVSDDGNAEVRINTDILSYLQEQHAHSNHQTVIVTVNGSLLPLSEAEQRHFIPFSFRGGHIGYLGYEVHHDTARYLSALEHGRTAFSPTDVDNSLTNPLVPTAAFLVADRSLVYDHEHQQWYIVGVAEKEESLKHTQQWIVSTARQLTALKPTALTVDGARRPVDSKPMFSSNQSRETYNANFAKCLDYIRKGDSYELCFTNQFKSKGVATPATPKDLYQRLRRKNPAPYSAFFNWNSGRKSTGRGSVALCCSSPERFVSMKRDLSDSSFQVEAKPIKGTCARVPGDPVEDLRVAESLRHSAKDRAENLMIVDLLRNDLSRVCKPGSVHVAKLMDIESYATVHQLVSTIRGSVNTSCGKNAVDVLQVCFPGGSMTGAPKLRSVQILEELEQGQCRGPYAGSLGYLSWNGCMDMNILIRTAVVTPASETGAWDISIGAGGAITTLSANNDEFDEMVLKTSAVVSAVTEWAHSSIEPEPTETVNVHS